MATVNRDKRKSYYSGTKLTQEQTANHLYNAGFRGDALWQMTALAGRESGYDPGAHGSERPRHELSGDRGLFQINYVWDQQLMRAGIIRSRADLLNPAINAKAAKYLYDQEGLSPWNAANGRWNANGTPMHGTDRFVAGAKAAAQKAVSAKGANAGSGSPSGSGSSASSGNTDASRALPGERSEAVRQIQQSLIKAGINVPGGADGYFGPKTQQAILDFQRAKNLPGGSRMNVQTATALGLEPTIKEPGVAGSTPANPEAQAALTSMLERYGINYPDAPAPTPAMLAFMRGLGMTLDTAEDATAKNNLRLNERAMQTRDEITRNNDRSLKRMAGDLQSRGVLSSGETNTRVGRQAEDVASKVGDVEQTLAEGIERNDQAFNLTKDSLRQQALEKTLNTETDQAREKAASEAQERSWEQQKAAADLAYERQKKAQDAAYAAQEAAYRQYSF